MSHSEKGCGTMRLADTLNFAEYITASAAGHIIQREAIDDDTNRPIWEDMVLDDEFESGRKYRIKTAPVLKPYSKEEDLFALVGKSVRVKATKTAIVRMVGQVIRVNGTWKICCVYDNGAQYTPEMFMKKYEFLDGTPIGVYVDEVPPPPKKAGKPSDDHDDDFEEEEELPDEGFEEDEDIGDGEDDPEEEGDINEP